jgi:hypothetical protein
MSKCLQFKILPKEQTLIKEFFNMRLMNRTPLPHTPNTQDPNIGGGTVPHALRQILSSKKKSAINGAVSVGRKRSSSLTKNDKVSPDQSKKALNMDSGENLPL